MTALNKQQMAASQPDLGVSLVLAGAGTGKTKTLVEKVKNIITGTEIKPENILILTFSRKAAGEIKERVREEIGAEADLLTSGTFHSFCLKLLKENKELFIRYAGYEKFPDIADGEKREKIIHDIIKSRLDNFLGIPADVIHNLLHRFNKLEKDTYNKLKETGLLNEFEIIKNEYRDIKKFMGIMDFEDITGYVINLLKSFSWLRRKVHHRYRYIFVDEYQDTSQNNFELLKLLLVDVKCNLFAVGDDWQSIYGFRDARPEYIVKMKIFFPHVKIHKLMINYRSNHEIVRLSNKFIKKNRNRTKKVLKSYMGRGGEVKFYKAQDMENEVSLINNILKIEKNKTGNIAILFRNNWQGEYIKIYLKINNLFCHDVEFLTIHASKGLEFDSVIIAGISDSIIPDSSSTIEEERRLLYVALTRARKSLHIIHYSNKKDISLFARELGAGSQ